MKVVKRINPRSSHQQGKKFFLFLGFFMYMNLWMFTKLTMIIIS